MDSIIGDNDRMERREGIQDEYFLNTSRHPLADGLTKLSSLRNWKIKFALFVPRRAFAFIIILHQIATTGG